MVVASPATVGVMLQSWAPVLVIVGGLVALVAAFRYGHGKALGIMLGCLIIGAVVANPQPVMHFTTEQIRAIFS